MPILLCCPGLHFFFPHRSNQQPNQPWPKMQVHVHACVCARVLPKIHMGQVNLFSQADKPRNIKSVCAVKTETQRKWLAKKPRRSGQHGAVDDVEEEKVGEVNDLVLLEMLFWQAQHLHTLVSSFNKFIKTTFYCTGLKQNYQLKQPKQVEVHTDTFPRGYYTSLVW